MPASIEELRQAIFEARTTLMSKSNVTATGIGYKITNGKKTNELSIICSVELKRPRAQLRPADLVPATISGVPTDVFPTGPLAVLQDRTGRHRPAPGGVSIGHFAISAGTLGGLVMKNGVHYILSNNHVIANSNDASTGDSILQPGPADGGSSTDDEIARLSEFVPIVFEQERNAGGGCRIAASAAGLLNFLAAIAGSRTRLRPYTAAAGTNTVDCAIAEPLNPGDVTDEILELGTLNSTVEGELDMEVRKSGRTTGLTSGVIQQVDVTARVSFGADRVAVFEDQLMAGSMAQGGDSGSVVTDTQNNAVGLLFAGSSSTTIVNRIQNVFSQLGVTLR